MAKEREGNCRPSCIREIHSQFTFTEEGVDNQENDFGHTTQMNLEEEEVLAVQEVASERKAGVDTGHSSDQVLGEAGTPDNQHEDAGGAGGADHVEGAPGSHGVEGAGGRGVLGRPEAAARTTASSRCCMPMVAQEDRCWVEVGRWMMTDWVVGMNLGWEDQTLGLMVAGPEPAEGVAVMTRVSILGQAGDLADGWVGDLEDGWVGCSEDGWVDGLEDGWAGDSRGDLKDG